ncbi:MAG: hypothetical protein [Podoviridae sp. ctcf755]|nr:MAG: hypothetical protein [Podoviridae sp. ctcf755]
MNDKEILNNYMINEKCIFKPIPANPLELIELAYHNINLNYIRYSQYLQEEKQYIADFNAENHCNPHNPCSEYPEFYEGLNKIRRHYGLDEIHPIGCPNKEKSYEKNK